jgi:hypothetical protein
MKTLLSFFSFFPTLIIVVWKTRKMKNEIATYLRLYLLMACIASFFVLKSCAGIKTGFQENQNRIDAANIAVQQFPALKKTNDAMIECYGSPYSMIRSRLKWVECDLAAIEASSKQGLGYEYIRFATARNRLLEGAGIKLYPPIEMPMPPPRTHQSKSSG